jgi:hypothetical protein
MTYSVIRAMHRAGLCLLLKGLLAGAKQPQFATMLDKHWPDPEL